MEWILISQSALSTYVGDSPQHIDDLLAASEFVYDLRKKLETQMEEWGESWWNDEETEHLAQALEEMVKAKREQDDRG
jgi:hypothetical protein